MLLNDQFLAHNVGLWSSHSPGVFDAIARLKEIHAKLLDIQAPHQAMTPVTAQLSLLSQNGYFDDTIHLFESYESTQQFDIATPWSRFGAYSSAGRAYGQSENESVSTTWLDKAKRLGEDLNFVPPNIPELVGLGIFDPWTLTGKRPTGATSREPAVSESQFLSLMELTNPLIVLRTGNGR